MSADSFSTNETHFKFQWPQGITGLERIALTCKGDLQRTLSAFFGKPISVARIWETPSTFPHLQATSSNPIIQTRRVHLLCANAVVCECTSTIKMSNPTTARLFLQEKFAIGQMFRRMERAPEFTLLEVGVQLTGERGQERLWRRYTLKTDGFECEITEVFDRRIFSDVEPLETIGLDQSMSEDTVLVHGINYPVSWIYGKFTKEVDIHQPLQHRLVQSVS